jgi:6-phosphofructokinase 1
LQRGGAPTTFDRVLATQYGAHAVRLIVEKRFGEMICYRPPQMNSVPIRDAVHRIREVDATGAAVQAARALGISFGDGSEHASPFVAHVEKSDTQSDFEPGAEYSLATAEAAAEAALAE